MDKTAEKKRERCKTCSCEYRAEIETMYLKEGKSTPFIAKYLEEKYGYKITAQSLLRHFRICLRKAEKKEKADKRTDEMLQEVLKRKIEIIDIMSKMINLLYEINMTIHSKVYKAGKVSGRTESDSIRNYTGELREYLKLYKDLIADNGKGTKVNEKELIEKSEEYRKRNAEMLKNIKSCEIKINDQLEEGDTDE